MLKILLVVDTPQQVQKLRATLPESMQAMVCATATAQTLQAKIIEQNPDFVLMSPSLIPVSKDIAKISKHTRESIRASTHQGIQLVPVTDVLYFQAEHKYVTAFHTRGQLLIEDTLNSLEQEFTASFVRIHRNTLVAIAKIEQLLKEADGRYYIKVSGLNTKLSVSRRQLPTVRKAILCL